MNERISRYSNQRLKLYFVRHGETMANYTNVYIPEHVNTFSPNGVRQVDSLTQRLLEYQFDNILVSPVIRAQNTILPYLNLTNQIAEVWPELMECCWQKEDDVLPTPNLLRGTRIQVVDATKFRFRDEQSVYCYHDSSNYADGLIQANEAVQRIKSLFFNAKKSILVVGHYWCNGKIMQMLQGKDPNLELNLENGKISLLQQNHNGKLDLGKMNF